MLQNAAKCCKMLHITAKCCKMPQYAAKCCKILQNAEYAYFNSLKDFKTRRIKALPRAAAAYGQQLKLNRKTSKNIS